MKTRFITLFLLLSVAAGKTSATDWKGSGALNVPINQEAKPYARWWWLGNTVNAEGLTYNLEEMARAGIGGVEITPIYGVKGKEAEELQYLSPAWMKMLQHVEAEGARLGIETNMATGTGWPFGGPWVPKEEAAAKAVIRTADGKDALKNHISEGELRFEVGRTGQKVKRAAPGGEGFVVDHMDKTAVGNYLARFDKAFSENGALPYSKENAATGKLTYPHTFFNDSYEVYGADWTPRLFEEFKARRGYDLSQHIASLTKADDLRTDTDKRILSDYRETISELILSNFTTQWTDWAHSHGAITRNQAHGSPANLLDLYAEVDIPECEGFGLSDFGIRGLRTDAGYTKKNFSDISMLKYASSGAHLSGAKYTSSETFTWLTEHFRTSLSQCKPDFDLFMVSGINHIFFHGACYSPKGEEWPGWRFYASVDISPNNNWWGTMPAFSDYIQRCQSFMQWGNPDNDVLVYLPFYDMIYDQPGTVALFDIHSMEKRAPKFIKAVQSIIKSGYDVDYISDLYLQKLVYNQGKMSIKSDKQEGHFSQYSAIVVPDVQFMPMETVVKLNQLAAMGAKIIFVQNYPTSLPGLGRKKMAKKFNAALKVLKKGTTLVNEYGEGLDATTARPEKMRNEQGLSCIRRSHEGGYHYFVSNIQGKDVDAFIELGVQAKAVALYNPMTGDITSAKISSDGKVRLQLRSGESILLRTFDNASEIASVPKHKYVSPLEYRSTELTQWTLTFKEAAPEKISGEWKMDKPKSWTELNDSLLNTTMATGVYKTTFPMGKLPSNGRMILDLGDVRESARVLINGKDAGTLFAVPFRLDITEYLIEGENTLEVEVANLPANRIAELDRKGVEWRKFKEINVVDLNYKKDLYGTWAPVPSGLCSAVRLIPATWEN